MITVARHSSEKISSGKIFLALVTGLALLGLDFGLSNFLMNIFYDLPNSRNQEYEGGSTFHPQPDFYINSCFTADQIGVKLMARACYDPKAAPE